eukprot:TRINITY_DN33471_c0_g1_i2.p1 TRINITY_DN33471_c0_g1~~TRINITY_DN33471_c0_g1_i2.p1  ORF type:complete len:291 (-),score=24.19 TRINITY_DN33471_c0_g1_i2:209-1081(-)
MAPPRDEGTRSVSMWPWPFPGMLECGRCCDASDAGGDNAHVVTSGPRGLSRRDLLRRADLQSEGAGAHLASRPAVTLSDGVYEGQWKMHPKLGEVRHGLGVLRKPDGTQYSGQWRNDVADGQGRCVCADGMSYNGEWEDGKQTGHAVQTWADGCKYEGQFLCGLKHGSGVFTCSRGQLIYKGHFVEDKMNGDGYYRFDDGRVYQGQWCQHQMDGDGALEWPDGSRYEGNFAAGLQSGTGTFFYSDGRKYAGQWLEGKQHGHGTIVEVSGQEKRLKWRKGVPLLKVDIATS